MKCKCGGYGYIVDWEKDKIVRCRKCQNCIDKKGYGEEKDDRQMDLFGGSDDER